MLVEEVMKLFLSLLFFTLPSDALAGEEQFTLLLEHYEDTSRPGFDARAFEGRQWDIAALLASYEPNNLQWTRPSPSRRPASYQGKSLCLRIRQTMDGKLTGRFVPYLRRLRILNNLLAQLRMRQSEMRQAGAHFKISYPSPCAGKEPRLRG